MKKGFTLIELLVVIAVIGILAAIVMVSLGGAKSNARDTKRKADLETLQGALEYYFSQNGAYPAGSFDSRQASQWASFGAYFTSVLPTMPTDPLNGSGAGAMCSNCGEYYYSGTTGYYVLSTYLENANSSFKTGSDSNGPYYSVTKNCTQTAFSTCN